MPYKNCCGRKCSVFGCSNSQRKLYKWNEELCGIHTEQTHRDCPCLLPFKLHMFPTNIEKRREWIAKINIKGFQPRKKSVVCSIHFIDGRPTSQNPAPQLLLGYKSKVQVGRRQLARHELEACPKKRQRTNNKTSGIAQAASDEIPEVSDVAEPALNEHEDSRGSNVEDIPRKSCNCPCTCNMQYKAVTKVDMAVQWENPISADHTYANSSSAANANLTNQCCQTDTVPYFTVVMLKDDEFPLFTSLTKSLFFAVVASLTGNSKSKHTSKISFPDQLLLVFMKLKLGLLFADLAWRFQIDKTWASKIFKRNIKLLSRTLCELIVWLPRNTIRATLPVAFKKYYPKTTCIIDCTEIFVQKPKNLKARGQSFSRYKSHNTIKILAAIAPNGMFMFLSDCYGGRASDKFIILDSTFLDHIRPGDEIMADRGFTIEVDVGMRGASLNVPAFTKGKKQLSEKEVTQTRRIATIRIDVERAFRRLKQFRILQHVIPLSQKHLIDDMIIVCAALCNLQPLLRKK